MLLECVTQKGVLSIGKTYTLYGYKPTRSNCINILHRHFNYSISDAKKMVFSGQYDNICIVTNINRLYKSKKYK